MTSFLDELRAARENVMARASKVLHVPGAHGKLAVRFRPPEDPEQLAGIIGSYLTRGELTRRQELQLLVDCCDQILHRNGTGELEEHDPPLRFDGSDRRWGDDVGNAHDCVRKLYNLDVVPLAAAGHADALVDWLQGLDAETAEVVEQEGKDEDAVS